MYNDVLWRAGKIGRNCNKIGSSCRLGSMKKGAFGYISHNKNSCTIFPDFIECWLIQFWTPKSQECKEWKNTSLQRFIYFVVDGKLRWIDCPIIICHLHWAPQESVMINMNMSVFSCTIGSWSNVVKYRFKAILTGTNSLLMLHKPLFAYDWWT